VVQCVAECCGVLRCVVVRCKREYDGPMKMLQVCCSVLQSVLQCAAVHCSMLQCVAMICSVWRWVAVRCSVLQYVAVCCSVLQCVEVESPCCKESMTGSMKMLHMCFSVL